MSLLEPDSTPRGHASRPVVSGATRTARALRPGLVILGILLVAANLRASITVVGPLLGDVRADLELSGSAASALISLPLICFAVFSPVAPGIARRWGMERTLAAALVVLAGGIVLRSLPWLPGLWLGTILLGLGIAALNVVLPALLKRDFPQSAGRLTGLYSAVQAAAAAVAAGFAVPLAGVTPSGWRFALGIWAGLAVVAFAIFSPQLRWRAARVSLAAASTAPASAPAVRPAAASALPADTATARTPRPASPPHAPRVGASTSAQLPGLRPHGTPMWRNPLAWYVTFFMGLQSTLFYSVITWWPSIEESQGTSVDAAGLHQGLLQLCGVGGTLMATWLIHRSAADQRVLVFTLVPLGAAGVLGELIWPGAGLWWVVLLGLATGGLIVLALALFVLRTREPDEAARLSGMAQSVGYLIAATGPLAVGALHDASGSWTPPLAALLGLIVIVFVFGYLASRPRVLFG